MTGRLLIPIRYTVQYMYQYTVFETGPVPSLLGYLLPGPRGTLASKATWYTFVIEAFKLDWPAHEFRQGSILSLV
jgi:hypothetical protein